jgi:multisubunit Na+/H+ antiporter MnhG subunit
MVGGKFSSQCRDNHKDTYGTAFVYIYVSPTCFFYIFKEKIVVLLLIPFVSPILIFVFLKMSMPVSPYYITHTQYLSELPMRTNTCQTLT